MRYKLVVWDFDGTLADSLPVGLRIFNQMAVEHGFLQIHDPEAARRLTVLRFIRAHKIPLLSVPRLVRKFLVHQAEAMAGTRLYPHVPAMLEAVRLHGFRQGIVSSNKELNIRTCLQANQMEDPFSFVIGCGGLFGKRRALKKLIRAEKVKGHEALYIGDEVRDIKAASRAGLDIAAVGWGFNNPETLARYRPTHLVESPDQLLDILQLSSPRRAAEPVG